MNKIKKLVAFLVCICFIVSIATINVSAASVPQSVQIISTITSAANSKLSPTCPYVWGAKGPDTFDCSGLAYWCYKAAGVTIPQGRAYDQKVTLEGVKCLVTSA